MNPFLKIVVGAVAVIVLVVVGMNAYRASRADYEYELAKGELRSAFLERSALVRAIPEPEAYVEEAGGLFRWYFDRWSEIQERFPSHRGSEEGYLTALEERIEAGRVPSEEAALYEASYRQVREVWDLLREGKYRPALTGVEGTLRLDFLEFQPAEFEGARAVKGRFVLWGAQRRLVEDKATGWGTREGAVTAKVDVQAEFRDVRIRLFARDGRQVAEATFNLPSGAYVPFPEAKIADFPPMAFIGAFSFPALPAEAERAEIEASVLTRTGQGREVEARFRWTREVPAEWRLPEGQAWEGAAIEEREELAPPARGGGSR